MHHDWLLQEYTHYLSQTNNREAAATLTLAKVLLGCTGEILETIEANKGTAWKGEVKDKPAPAKTD